MAQYQLPNDFFFGAAMSGPQTEGQWNQGGKLENLWDTWSIQDLGSFYNCVGSYAGNDFMAKYQEDFRILKDLGLDTYRTSIQWSRLLDADGNLNEEGAAWYHELFRASREAGLEPFVNLYHFDMPTYLFNRGGWESREVVEAYAHYADVAFREFGQEIKYWFTFNEPIVEPEQRYQEGVWFPQLHDFNRARTVQYHISLAHALAVANYRRAYDEGAVRSDAKIGMINCFTPVYTKENSFLPTCSTAWPRAALSSRSVPATKRFSSRVLSTGSAATTTTPRVFRRRRARSISTVCRTLPTSTCGPTPL